jgi:large subunit ribosomal protein L24
MRVLTYRQRERRKQRVRQEQNAARQHVHVKAGDTVRVMRGEDKGKEGKVLRVYLKTGRVVVEGVNIVKRHRKAQRAEEESAIIDFPAPVHASNLMLLDPKSGAPTRARARIAEGEETSAARRRQKERVSVKSGEPITTSR